MSSTFGGLNIASRGLLAQQAALDTVGHNVSNANTDGYSRQRVNLGTTRTVDLYGSRGVNQVGTGVDIDSVTRARNSFVDKQMWAESSTLGYGTTMQSSLSKVEGVFNEPTSGTGLQTVLNQFWSAWQTLSTNASDSGARTAVRQRGVEVANAIQHAAEQLENMAVDVNSTLDIKVGNINQITSEIYGLNKQISTIETGGSDHANDLRDKRDLLVDQLSSLGNISVNEDQYGNYIIQSGGVTLVDKAGYTALTTEPSSKDPVYGYEVKNVYVAPTGTAPARPMNFTGGEIKGLIDSRDSTTSGVKGYLNNLDTISKFLLQDFNNVHKEGYGTDNSTGNNFFGAPGTDYSSSSALADGKWLTELGTKGVNTDLFTGTGLNLIAAKTAAGSVTMSQSNVTMTQSNTSGGKATVAVSGTYSSANSTTTITLKITSIGTGGQVTGMSYSTDNGASYTPLVPTVSGSTYTFPDFTVAGLTFTPGIATATANAANDTYTFTVPQGNAAGDNATLLANQLKTATSSTLGGATLDSYYASTIGTLGVQSQDAQRTVDNQQSLVDQITTWREETSGVNMDEEMTNMIRFQKGYNAAARILTTMDEMLDKLINGTGMAGR